jgi:predicted CXXCH cytochrome family protein
VRTAFLTLLAVIFLMGDTPTTSVTVLVPFGGDSVSYDTGKLFILSADKQAAGSLLVSTQWSLDAKMEVSSKNLKEEFPKSFVRIVPDGATFQSVVFTYRFFKGYSVPETLSFAYGDTISLRSLWNAPAFVGLVKKLQGEEVLAIIVSMRGWRDTVRTTDFEDPVAENRSLFKVPVRLVPGENEIWFAPDGDRARAVRFVTTYAHESVAPADRPERFHDSELEAGCANCHEGLPSADSGRTMTADCSTCHREHFLADYTHSPVEMKECGTCHSWSPEKKAVEVAGGVPEVCGACHEEKVTAAEESPFPHAVAGECLTCHSPHSSQREHILKADVNDLCAGCHEGFGINHPVGRHPVRFVKLATTGKEISCVSCHDPHGSTHSKLLVAENAGMEICSVCH